MTLGADPSNPISLLFTCVGRRIELLQAFRAAARMRGLHVRVLAADYDLTAPGLSCADAGFLMPPVSDPGYLSAIEAIVSKEHIRMIVPTIDTDLPAMSAHRDRLDALGCTVLIGDPGVIRVCRDKLQTYQLLQRSKIDTPTTYTPAEVRALSPKPFPLFLKPRTGSASQWVQKIEDEEALEFFLKRVADPIIQEFVSGSEYTLDAYVGLTGEVRCVVPRLRWQVRAGEVSKGIVVKDREIMEAGRRAVAALGNSCRGIVTLQCIVTPTRRIRFIEINPRFGGGAPLSIAAGADFPGWILDELCGRSPTIAFDGFQDGMCMLRYDWSVFLPLGPGGKPAIITPPRACPEF